MRTKFKAREYQDIAIEFIMDTKRCGVWAEMGLGKTVAALTATNNMHMLGESTPTLIIAPLRVAKSVWTEEARKWDHLEGTSVMPILGSEAERRQSLRYDAQYYTVNYENIPWLVEYLGDRWMFRTVIADESTKLKGFRTRQGTERAKMLARVIHTKVKRYIGLTGTPAPNGLLDLWGQAWMIDRGHRLGLSYSGFRDRWFNSNYNGYGHTPRENAEREIYAALADVCLSLRAKDWFDLADPIVTDIKVDLPSKARTLYDKMEREFYIELEGKGVEAFNAAVLSGKLLQIANGAAYVHPEAYQDEQPNAKEWRLVHDAKLEALEDVIEEAAGMPVLVAYNFRSDLARLKKAFPKGETLDAPDAINRWNKGKIPVMFAHPASAGHGLNLQYGGNILCYFGHTWNLEHKMQMLERIGPVRQMQAGLDRPVFVYNIIARDTIDEIVMKRMEGKKDVQELLLEAMKRRKK